MCKQHVIASDRTSDRATERAIERAIERSSDIMKNSLISMVLSFRSILESSGSNKYAECTSRHVKRTSGARVMICFCRSIARSLDRSIDRSLDRSNYFGRSNFEILMGNYLGGRISNCWGTSYLFRLSPSFELLFKQITIEHFHCFKE